MESKPKKELVRISFYNEEISLDLTGKAKGRGVYLCPSLDCIEKAKKRNSFKRNLPGLVNEEQIEKILEDVMVNEKKD